MPTAAEIARKRLEKMKTTEVKQLAKVVTISKPSNKDKTAHEPRDTKTPWLKIKEMYEAGKSYTEIGKATGLLRPKFVSPISLVCNRLTALKRGVIVNGKTIKIKTRKIAKGKK